MSDEIKPCPCGKIPDHLSHRLLADPELKIIHGVKADGWDCCDWAVMAMIGENDIEYWNATVRETAKP